MDVRLTLEAASRRRKKGTRRQVSGFGPEKRGEEIRLAPVLIKKEEGMRETVWGATDYVILWGGGPRSSVKRECR